MMDRWINDPFDFRIPTLFLSSSRWFHRMTSTFLDRCHHHHPFNKDRCGSIDKNMKEYDTDNKDEKFNRWRMEKRHNTYSENDRKISCHQEEYI